MRDSRSRPSLRRRGLRAAACGLATLVVLALGACGSQHMAGPALTANGCTLAEQPGRKNVALDPPRGALDPAKTYTVAFQTNCGDFAVKLDVKHNPVTATSFAYLVRKGVYDDTWFHRIIANYVIQGGDPFGDGTGDAGYDVREKPRGEYRVGTVAMAKSEADPSGTSSAQFYIVIGEGATQLPKDYAIAGAVASGARTIDRIAAFAAPSSDQSGTPTGVAVIKRATLKISG